MLVCEMPTEREEAPELPSYGSGSGRLLVDISDPGALWEALDADLIR